MLELAINNFIGILIVRQFFLFSKCEWISMQEQKEKLCFFPKWVLIIGSIFLISISFSYTRTHSSSLSKEYVAGATGQLLWIFVFICSLRLFGWTGCIDYNHTSKSGSSQIEYITS